MNPLDYSFSYNKRIISANDGSAISMMTDTLFGELNHTSRLENIRRLSLNNILCNLIIAYYNDRYLMLSQNSNDYSGYNKFGLRFYTYRLIIGWINLLLSKGYIRLIPGYYDNETGKGKRTRIFGDEKLLSLADKFPNEIYDFNTVNYNPPLILKDKNKNLINYSISEKLQEKIDFLNEYNEFISGVQIFVPINSQTLYKSYRFQYPLVNEHYINIYHTLVPLVCYGIVNEGIPLLITLEPNQFKYKSLQGQLFRVYNNGKFTEGGRFYGATYQQLSECDRNKILINGSSVVEVDYSSFHLNMLYNKTNRQFDGDPYNVTGIDELRPLLKVVSLIAVNSGNPTQALRAVKEEIRKNIEFQRLKRIYKLDEKELLRKFESTHCRISNYFYSGIGIKLQHIDSQIAETILKYFSRRNIPCLPVHDSFLVPSEHETELKEVMNSVYKKYLGFNAKLK